MDHLLIDQSDNLVLTYKCNVKELCQLYSRGINLDLAPEVYSFEEVTEAVDWWSFGAILYELLVGMVHFPVIFVVLGPNPCFSAFKPSAHQRLEQLHPLNHPQVCFN